MSSAQFFSAALMDDGSTTAQGIWRFDAMIFTQADCTLIAAWERCQ
jgi:hypothetical protein